MFNCNGFVVSQLTYAEPELIHNLHTYFSFVEIVRLNNSKILFWEKHYFRIVASLRRYRYKIPVSFTMEKLEGELIKLTNKIDNKIENGLFRYQFIKADEETEFIISLKDLNPIEINTSDYEIDLYKDTLVFSNDISNMSKTNSDLRLISKMYAKENGLSDVVLLNDKKKITETLNGTIFLLKSNQIQTPNLLSGCQNLVLREVFLEWLEKYDGNYNVIETEINPFELQKSEEIFIISLENGLQCVSSYRRSSYFNEKSYHLFENFLLGLA